MAKPQVAIRVQFERPVNLKKFTREFINDYIDELNTQVDNNAQKFADTFYEIHSGSKYNVENRRLSPEYTGASGKTIHATWEPLPHNITVLTGKATLTVGYEPKSGRTPIYIPSIESGWIGGQGSSTRRGQITSQLFSKGNDRAGIRRSSRFKVSNSKRIRNYDGLADKRLKDWAYKKLGIRTVRRQTMTRADRARWWWLRKKVFEEGESGRDVVDYYANSDKVRQLWDRINQNVLKRVNKSFRVTKQDQRIVSGVLGRGTG